MNPFLALLMGYGLAFFAIRQDVITNRMQVTSALWLPTLWMMRCGSRGIDYWLNGGDNARLDPILVAVLIVAGLIVLSRRRCVWPAIFSQNSAIFFFYAYIVVSVTWTAEVENPVIKLFRPLCDLVMALVVATEPNPRQAIITIFRRAAFLLIPLSVVLIKYYPDLGRMQGKHWAANMWIGVTTHKNPLGQLCVASLLGFLWTISDFRMRHQKLPRLPFVPLPVAFLYIAMIAYLLNGGGNDDSRSSTAFTCLAWAIALYFLLGKLRNNTDRLVGYFMMGVVAIGILSMTLAAFGTSLQAIVAQVQGKNATFSDRTYLWADVIRIGKEHMLLGTGYGGFWVPSLYPKLSPQVDNRPAECHNGYLETYANLGLVGVALLAFIIIQSLRNAMKTAHVDFEYGRIRLVLLLTIIVFNYTEASFPRGTHIFWFSFLMVALYAAPFVESPTVSTAENISEIVESEPEHAAAVLSKT
jgi:exopolysaccharide production protein ExoQ